MAQFLGAFAGASLVYLIYAEAFAAAAATVPAAVSATVFHTSPQPHLSLLGGVVDQILGTAVLLLVVHALGDARNPVHAALGPLYVGFAVLAIGVCFGFNCGYAINPARDLGPRAFAFAAGWREGVFDSAWFLVPLLAPLAGGVLGGGVYQVLIGAHWAEEKGGDLTRNKGFVDEMVV